ncbi:MAG: type II secretion system F family protein [Lachnospiraceae bacterium]|nr:type II secretion system F family protein [Lachnospiraceae bacterium]
MSKLRELALFCHKMDQALRAGFDIEHALVILREDKTSPLSGAIHRTSEGVRLGMQLSEAMRRDEAVYTPELVNIVYVTEQTGHVEQAFSRMAVYFDEKESTRKRLLQAALYPMIVLIVAIICFLAVASVWHVLPAAIAIVVILVAGITFLILSFYGGSALVKGSSIAGDILLHLPFLGRGIKTAELADLADNMALFYDSGVAVETGLRYCMKSIRYQILRDKVARAAEIVSRGIPLSDALQMQDVFPSDLIASLRIGEASGNVDGMLKKIAQYYRTDEKNRREIMMTILRQ